MSTIKDQNLSKYQTMTAGTRAWKLSLSPAARINVMRQKASR